MSKVKVRIAVAVDHTGNWNSCGWREAEDSDAMQLATEAVVPGEARYWLEAELDLPTETTVQATVTEAV